METLWRSKQQPTPVFLPREAHGQRSPAGYSLWGHKESDMTEQLSTYPHMETVTDSCQVSNQFGLPLIGHECQPLPLWLRQGLHVLPSAREKSGVCGAEREWAELYQGRRENLTVEDFSSLPVCVLKSLQLCPTLSDTVDHSLPGSSVHGIIPARILEWVAMPSSWGSSRPKGGTHISYVSCIDRRVLYHWHHWGRSLQA